MTSPDFAQPAVRRAWLRRLLEPIGEAHWDELVSELFAWQFARVPAYRRLCSARGITPLRSVTWRQIPAAPQQLFKLEQIFAHSLSGPEVVYETSGTTTGAPGRQHLLFADIYRAVSIEGARRAGFFEGDPQMYFLTPSPRENRRSSLSAMFGFWQKAARQRGNRFQVRRAKFETNILRQKLEEAVAAQQPVALCGTAFSFVHLLDTWADRPSLPLPAGSRLLETGGFKGRSRELSKADLYAQLARTFTVGEADIWNEYGMSELSSQAYARGVAGLHRTPPWARVLVVDPATQREVALGRRGLVRWIDLANVDSIFAVQTLDLAERTADGFRLLGRMPRATPRGCSLDAEDLAGAARRYSLSP